MSSNMERFLNDYGTKGLGLLVARFIQDAPEFRGDQALAKEIGRAIGLLESILEEQSKEIHS